MPAGLNDVGKLLWLVTATAEAQQLQSTKIAMMPGLCAAQANREMLLQVYVTAAAQTHVQHPQFTGANRPQTYHVGKLRWHVRSASETKQP